MTIKAAVESQFEVKVSRVRLANSQGKVKRTMSLTGKRYGNSYGKRSDSKRAYVTLKEGFSLPFFAAIEEEEKQEKESQAKIDKAMAKQSDKETKQRRGFRRAKATKEKEVEE
jgi:ribosomal protein L23